MPPDQRRAITVRRLLCRPSVLFVTHSQSVQITHPLPRRATGSTTPPLGGGKPRHAPQASPSGASVVTRYSVNQRPQDQSSPLWMRTWNALMEERRTLEQHLNTEVGLDERTSWMLTRLRRREEELCSLIRALEEGTWRSE